MGVRFEKNGQMMIEILVAVAVMVLVLVAIVSRVVDAVSNANYARNQLLATRFAQEGVEWARSQRDQLGWAAFENLVSSDPTYCVSDINVNLGSPVSCGPGDEITGTVFLREVSFDYNLGGGVGPYADINVVVSWDDRVGTHQSDLNTRLSKWSKQL